MKKQKIWQVFFTLILFLFAAGQARAFNDDFHCGNKLVSLGDRKYEVLVKCGQPSYRDSHYERRIKRDFYRDLNPPRESERYREPLFAEETVEVEEWVYNFGSNRLLRFLTFENGILVSIETGDYGY